MKWKQAVRRAARTFFQTFLAVVVGQGGFTFTQTDLALVRSAGIAGIAAVVSLVHNLLEDTVSAIDTRV